MIALLSVVAIQKLLLLMPWHRLLLLLMICLVILKLLKMQLLRLLLLLHLSMLLLLLALLPARILRSCCGELLYALGKLLYTLCWWWLRGIVREPLLLLVVPVPLPTRVQGHLGGLDLLSHSCVVPIVLRLVVVQVVLLVVVVILIRNNIILVVILPPRSIILVLFQLSCSIHFCWLFHHWLSLCSILILVWVEKWNGLHRLLLLLVLLLTLLT